MGVCAAQLLSAMVAKLGNRDDPLPQESFEGVDEDEWVSECLNIQCPRYLYLEFCFEATVEELLIVKWVLLR